MEITVSTKLVWLHTQCPICNRDVLYPEGEGEPTTCGNFECIDEFLRQHGHPISDAKKKEVLIEQVRNGLSQNQNYSKKEV